MKDLGTLLLERSDRVIELWTVELCCESTHHAVLGLIPQVVETIAYRLTNADSVAEDAKTTEHSLRQGIDTFAASELTPAFDMTKLPSLFSVLRSAILSTLLPLLESEHSVGVIDMLRTIDCVLSDVTASLSRHYLDRIKVEQIDPRQQELLSCNQELLRLVQMQKDNASHMAHELKNPLHAIISFSSILLRQKEKLSDSDPATDPATQREIKQLTRILDNAQQLSRLVTNMLEVSRQESMQQSLKLESVDLDKLVADVVGSLDAAVNLKGLVLTIDCDQSPRKIQTDSLRLQQIIMNLVSNAIRYTDIGRICVRCYTADKDRWVLAVEDTGRGIRTDQQTKIFSPYFRVGKDADQIEESSGLGLTIVSKLVELLKGEIALVSTLGKGSTFKVTLPIQL